jgi:arylsulfatase A
MFCREKACVAKGAGSTDWHTPSQRIPSAISACSAVKWSFSRFLYAPLVAAFFLMAGPRPADAQAPDRPNVVLIMTDDQGWFELGVHGNPYIETPNMDRLAAEGVRFNRFYASPVCTPTRASLMTGRHYQRTGAIDTYMGRDTLSADEITLAQVFQSQGYRTGQFGKWHLGRYMKYHPNQRGFDEYFGFWQYGFTNRYMDPDQLFLNREPVINIGYITDVLTDQAIAFIKRDRRVAGADRSGAPDPLTSPPPARGRVRVGGA